MGDVESSDLILGGALIVLFGLAVTLGAAEAALLRVPRVRVAVAADAGDRAARRVLPLVDDLPRVMNTILLAVLLTQIGAATITGVLAERHLGGIGITVSSIALTLLLFVYAEAIPKTYAVRHPLAVARRLSLPVRSLTRLMRPIVSVLVAVADLQAPGKGVVGRLDVTEAELRRLAAEAAVTGSIDPSDAELVDRAFELGDLLVRDILVPRTDVVAVEQGTPVVEAIQIAITSGHRRLPIHTGSLDDIVGVVRLSDLAAALTSRRTITVDEVTSPVITVPDSKPAFDLLREMQRAAVHFAVVVDEHGGTEGIATIEDVVARLVGNVADEGWPPQEAIRTVGPDRWVVDAGAGVDELEDVLEVGLPRGDWTSVGGLIIGLLARIPVVGDELETAGHRFKVIDADRTRVKTVVVERLT